MPERRSAGGRGKRLSAAGIAVALSLLLTAAAHSLAGASSPQQGPPSSTPTAAEWPTAGAGLTPRPAGASALAVQREQAGASSARARRPLESALPTVALEEYWRRMHELRGAPVMDRLRLLPADQRDDPLFGVNNALVAENATAPLLRGIGATIDRVEVRWDEIEPTPGEFCFDRLDSLVAQAERWDLAILAVVVGAPAWAVDRPERSGAGPPRGLHEPALLHGGIANLDNPWASFLSALARRYGSRIAAWEVWNEPNIPEFWRGSVAEYARLYEVARAVLQAEVPGAPVLVAGLVQDDGAFLRELVRELCSRRDCASPPFEHVAWHVYNNPRDVLKVAETTRAVLAPYGVEPIIWITEANVPIDDPLAPLYAVGGPGNVSLVEQAAFVMQVYALARAGGIRTVAFYRAADVEEGRFWGLLRQNVSGRPALFAYRAAAQWLSRSRLVRLGHPRQGVTQVRLRRPGETVDVVWTDAPEPVVVRVEAEERRGMVVRLDGTTAPIRARGNSFEVALPAAPPPHPPMVPLGEPVLLVVPDDTLWSRRGPA